MLWTSNPVNTVVTLPHSAPRAALTASTIILAGALASLAGCGGDPQRGDSSADAGEPGIDASDGAPQSAGAVALPPVNGQFDYQLGGDYAPVAAVAIVDRDRSSAP